MNVTITHLGCAGHLIVASNCAWRRHTQIGGAYRVSTVGNYFPERGRERKAIGAEPDAFFETKVFRTIDQPADGAESEGCGCKAVMDYSEIDCRRYATAGEAQRGHEEFVATYVALLTRELELAVH